MKPPTHSDDTPIVALMIAAGPMLMSANFATLPEVANFGAPPPPLTHGTPPRGAGGVLRVDFDRKLTRKPAVVAFAIRAPANTAGQTRWPKSSTMARANPVGGQTGVALGLCDAS